jgi:hypothetical protein
MLSLEDENELFCFTSFYHLGLVSKTTMVPVATVQRSLGEHKSGFTYTNDIIIYRLMM